MSSAMFDRHKKFNYRASSVGGGKKKNKLQPRKEAKDLLLVDSYAAVVEIRLACGCVTISWA